MNLITEEHIREQIPYYLTQDAKEGLVKALKDFPNNINYYLPLNKFQNEVLQGDGWDSLEIFNFDSGEKKPIQGIILSNSCDISPDNSRSIPARIVFAPILPLSSYEERLRKHNIDINTIKSKVISIKLQKVTSLFYLPKGGGLDSDYIAVLDDLHTIPLSVFQKRLDKKKKFTLSQVGFYLFLFKISIHFCRFHENLERN